MVIHRRIANYTLRMDAGGKTIGAEMKTRQHIGMVRHPKQSPDLGLRTLFVRLILYCRCQAHVGPTEQMTCVPPLVFTGQSQSGAVFQPR